MNDHLRHPSARLVLAAKESLNANLAQMSPIVNNLTMWTIIHICRKWSIVDMAPSPGGPRLFQRSAT